MRQILFVFSTFAVLALAYWAYHENYKTQAALEKVQALQRDIGHMREELMMLRAEWAYLNRPDRLRSLSEMNFDRLGLMPLRPEQFGRVDQIAYPGMSGLGADGLDVTGATDVMATGGGE